MFWVYVRKTIVILVVLGLLNVIVAGEMWYKLFIVQAAVSAIVVGLLGLVTVLAWLWNCRPGDPGPWTMLKEWYQGKDPFSCQTSPEAPGTREDRE